MIKNRRGLTLVEVLIAMVILVLACICTLSYFQYGLGGIRKEGDQRAALEIARSRMEQLTGAGFDSIKPDPPDANLHYVTWACTGVSPCTWKWVLSSSLAAETVTVNGHPNRQMLTTVQWIDDSTVTGTEDLLLISAKVWYRPGTVDSDFTRVELRAMKAPS